MASGDESVGDESVTMRVGVFEVTTYRSAVDGAVVFEIDSSNAEENAAGPLCRIYLNDGCIWQNPPYPGDESMREAGNERRH